MNEKDYLGVRPECGCVTAWMAAEGATKKEVRDFYRSMADTGREVKRGALDKFTFGSCTHKDDAA